MEISIDSETEDERTEQVPLLCRTTQPLRMILARETGPGPAAYTLPHTIGYRRLDKTKPSAPAFTLKGRNEYIYKQYGPGPGAYYLEDGVTRRGLNIGREFSLGPKLPTPKDYNSAPPPKYYPKAVSCKKRSPMGQKIKPFSAKPSPAPNAYTLPPVISNVDLGFHLKGRVKFGSYVHLSETPGPVALPEMELWKKNSPQFIIGERTKVRSETVGPGPAAYMPVKMSASKARAPSFYFGCRHSTFLTPLFLKLQ